ncbi:unnamed protein product [Cyclocybe aegerita]|uniref:Uncharacterized protein n=1 Tax=Cyclocybe aegerita TaxID=1973307 RepID=A0A8S0X1R3_CYCAE|nr:unnamed protein product [Cyclocybe aegerita]
MLYVHSTSNRCTSVADGNFHGSSWLVGSWITTKELIEAVSLQDNNARNNFPGTTACQQLNVERQPLLSSPDFRPSPLSLLNPLLWIFLENPRCPDSRFNTLWSSSVSDSKPATFGKVKTSNDHSATTLKTLKAVGNPSQAETLRDSITEATGVLETLTTAKHIGHDLRRLGQEICGLVIDIATGYKKTPAAQDFQVGIEEIDISQVSRLLCHKYFSYPRWMTFICRQSDRGKAAELRSGVAGIANGVSGKNKFEALITLELWNEENATPMKHLE